MLSRDITIPAAILALLRGDVSSRFLADRFGVTEAQVNEWKDVFIVAGILALHSHGRRGPGPEVDPNSDPEPEEPTTKLPT